MPLRQRLVDINVPNATAKPVTAILTVEPLDPRDLEGVDFEGCPLTVRRFGLTRDLCGDPRRSRPQKRLSVRLGPFEETTIRVLIETQEPPKGRRALAAFRVTDRRGKKVAGGVTVVCTSPPYGTSLPSAPDPANPCPLALAAPLYCVDPGTDPSKTLTPPGTIDPRHPRDLVAVIENTGPDPVRNASVYLEHAGTSGLEVTPRVWHLGDIEPGGHFWATWRVNAAPARTGRHEATFVAQGEPHEPVRLRARFRVSAQGSD